MAIQNYILRKKYQNLYLTNFTKFTMVDKKNGGSTLQDLKTELQNKVLSHDETSTLYGGVKHSEMDAYGFNGCGGMIPQ